jgi:hypothetical protein
MPTARGWFNYTTGALDPYDPLNYNYATFSPPCPATGTRICSLLGLYDPAVSSHPTTISSNLSTYITDAQAAGNAKPSLGKKYVYVIRP